jgi:hypothetical protein
MNITEFEQRVLDQDPVGSGHYDAMQLGNFKY